MAENENYLGGACAKTFPDEFDAAELARHEKEAKEDIERRAMEALEAENSALPALFGSFKQADWALDIRKSALRAFRNTEAAVMSRHASSDDIGTRMSKIIDGEALCYFLAKGGLYRDARDEVFVVDSSRWWIDNRGRSVGSYLRLAIKRIMRRNEEQKA